MRCAYADPPYLGQAKRHYHTEEINHAELIDRLCTDFHEGWALSCSSPSLAHILPLCPQGIRIAAWVKPFAIYKPHVNPAYAWEPVIFYGGRKRSRQEPTVRDWVACNITLKRGLCGAKPEDFCLWIFALLGLQRGDELVDLFPGSGAVTSAWEKWRQVCDKTIN
jgi:hypothetical protein